MKPTSSWPRAVLAIIAALGVLTFTAGPGPSAARAAESALAAPSALAGATRAADDAPAALAPAPQLTPIRFASPQAVSDAGVFLASARGFLREVGMELELVPIQSGPQAIVPLGTGEVDVAGGAFSIALLNAIDRGVGIKMVADKGTSRPGFQFSQLVLRRDLAESGAVRQPADLRGRKVAVASLQSGPEATAHHVMRENGLSIDDLDITVMGYPDMVTAFSNRAIDAGVLIEPLIAAGSSRGLVSTWEPGWSSTAFGGPYQAAMILYSGRFASQAEQADRFMTAYLRGVRVYNDAFVKNEGREDVIRTLTEVTSVKDPAVYDQMQMASLDPDGRISRQSVQMELDYFRQRGYYTGPLTLDQFIDSGFAERAAAQLGPYR